MRPLRPAKMGRSLVGEKGQLNLVLGFRQREDRDVDDSAIRQADVFEEIQNAAAVARRNSSLAGVCGSCRRCVSLPLSRAHSELAFVCEAHSTLFF